jgi:hypothetical protein
MTGQAIDAAREEWTEASMKLKLRKAIILLIHVVAANRIEHPILFAGVPAHPQPTSGERHFKPAPMILLVVDGRS